MSDSVTSPSPVMDESTKPREASSPSKRLLSLDTFRGLIMCTLASSGLALAATARKLGYGPDAEVDTLTGQIWQWLGFHNSHPFWNSQFYMVGCSYWDLIQPAFMFMVGVSMPYSYASRRQRGDSMAKLSRHALLRSLVLVVLGVFLQTHYSGLESSGIFVNVLTQIGLGYFFVFLLLGRSARVQIGVGVVVLAAYTAWFLLHPVPDPFPTAAAESISDLHVLEQVAPHFAIHTNPASAIDVELFKIIPQEQTIPPNPGGYATLNFIPSAVTMLLGLLAGTLLRSDRDENDKVRRLLIGGAVCMVVAVVMSFTICPVVKKIWTPAWALYSGAWVLWILAILYWIIDVRGWKKWTFPLVVVGMNSLAMYLMGMLMKGWVKSRFTNYFGDNIFAGSYGPTLQALAAFLVLWLICLYLYRSKLFFRV